MFPSALEFFNSFKLILGFKQRSWHLSKSQVLAFAPLGEGQQTIWRVGHRVDFLGKAFKCLNPPSHVRWVLTKILQELDKILT